MNCGNSKWVAIGTQFFCTANRQYACARLTFCFTSPTVNVSPQASVRCGVSRITRFSSAVRALSSMQSTASE